ncbi:MAG: toxin-antitoxin system protein [Gaiellaceae bacterium]
MPGTTVRIRKETREALRELERLTGQGPQDLLARAVDQFRRSLTLAEINLAYGALRADADAWAEAEAERAEWEGTLADGKDDTEAS